MDVINGGIIMTVELKEVISDDERYKGFTILDNPVPFNEFAKDQDIQLVQLHSTQIIQVGNEPPYKKFIIGFWGQFEWKNNKLNSLDGDSYSDSMMVLGHKWFTNEEEGITKGLDILTGEDW
jgi:hypothetical protein